MQLFQFRVFASRLSCVPGRLIAWSRDGAQVGIELSFVFSLILYFSPVLCCAVM